MTLSRTLILSLAAVALFALPRPAAAQLKPEDAAKFIGGWALGLDTPQGAMTMTLTVKNDDGKVVGSIVSDLAPEPQTITDITKDGESLVLKYMLDFQGQGIPAKIVMTPAGDAMGANFDFADGQFVLPASSVTKK
ncbi:MAG TPA: hypothetical protein VJP86_05080 [Vicinamibacterales bacterium]|jgi:hypothetical protein|nr:hypothetical protein [Vicinamibacterales bacterium]